VNKRLVEPLEAGDANIETHTLVVPYYDRFYSVTHGPNKWFNVNGRVVDDSKIVSKNLELFIKAPLQPIGGC
jgi:hypothetical protein